MTSKGIGRSPRHAQGLLACHRGAVDVPSPIHPRLSLSVRAVALLCVAMLVAVGCSSTGVTAFDTTTTTTTPGSSPTSASPSNPTPDPEPGQPDPPDIDEAPPESTPDSNTTLPPPPPGEEPQDIPPVNPNAGGRIAVIDNLGNLVLVDPDGTNQLALTDYNDNRVSQPAWAPDGQFLAWTEVAESIDLAVGAADGSFTTETATPFPSFYTSWAPDQANLAILGNDSGGVGVTFAEFDGQQVNANIAAFDSATPYFFDWTDERQIVSHAGVDLRTVSLDVGISSSTEIGDAFQAPEALADGSVLVAERGAGNIVTLRQRNLATGASTDLVRYESFGLFVVHPNETRIAIHVVGADQFDPSSPPTTTGGALRQPDVPTLEPGVWIYDIDTGAVSKAASAGIIAMYWSPVEERLLLLEAEEDGLVFQVWSPNGSTRTNPFVPSTRFFTEYLPFYDQFAKNTSFWSPEGSSFVYAAQQGDQELILVHDAARNGASTPIALGSIGVWSPEGGGGGAESVL